MPEQQNIPAPPSGFVPMNAASTPPPPAGFVSAENQNPYPISDAEKGALHQTVKTGESLLKLPGHVWDALTQPPQDDDEKAAYNLPARRLPSQLQLAIYRLVQKPMEREQEVARAYNTIAQAHYTDPDWKKETNPVKRAARMVVGEYSGDDVANQANHRANMHHIASGPAPWPAGGRHF